MLKSFRHYYERFPYHWWGRFGAPGLAALASCWALDKLKVPVKGKYFPIHLKGIEHPFYGRFGTSDELVFNQIFIEREYLPVSCVRNPKLIIDCGANVGYSAIWFLNQYPGARVIAVEPDPDNYQLCRKNLLPYGDRARVICAGIWPHQTGLKVVHGHFGDGREWAVQVRACETGEKPDLFGVEIRDLLAESGRETIDILKIDIEASEKKLFAENYEAWLSKVKNLVIELHGPDCDEVFFEAMSAYDYHSSRSGELTVCRNISPKVSAKTSAMNVSQYELEIGI